ncbi:MAG TPA: efflux RND transporter permease subunit, partial [Gemmatimonadales bacterium]|nr:efflux RND transporter permease subunit [Gemmatimonadales bacterium]
MILSDTAIKRPVFTTMLVVSLLLFGYLGIRGMGIDQFPKVDFPYVTVTTILPGASPEITESDLTQPIEEQLNTIEGVKQISSVSALGVSQILVQFQLDRDVDIAAQDVRDKVALAKANLPADAEEPLVQKLDINAQPVVWVALTGLDVKAMSVFADEVLKPRLQTLEGVGDVRLAGYRAREMRIWLDRGKLRARSLTPTDVIRAIQAKNVELPAGILEAPGNEFRVNVRGQLDTPQQFDDIVIAYRDGGAVRLRDVGYAQDGLEPRRGLARFNGVPAVGLGVAPRPGANTVAVADLVKAQLATIQADLPPGMHITIASDASNTIRKSIDGARDELILGALFAVIVVFFFLRSWRSTLVIAATIPTSLIATFGMMRALGFTINNVSMLALSLSVGIVVDDAIVVLENIFHYIERGRPSPEAASIGTTEIFFAALAAT